MANERMITDLRQGGLVMMCLASLATATSAELPVPATPVADVKPATAWKIHDMTRPQPPVVTPAPVGLPVPPPSDAVILFDGSSLDGWTGTAPIGDDKALTIGGKDLVTKQVFGDCHLHVEWAAPAEVNGTGQGRGNSGVFLMGRYEVQVLDCYNNQTYPDGQTAAIYGMHAPLANACRPPGEWQTYDIIWTAPRFAGDGALVSPAFVTVIHNGIPVQVHAEIYGASTAGVPSPYKAHGDGPVKLQDHHNPVRYRNIWVRRLDLTAQPRPR